MSDSVDLVSFTEAIKAADAIGAKKHILLGNGFSIGAHPLFRYESLYEKACANGLSAHIQAIFDHYGTQNFERVLRQLSEARWMARHYQLSPANHDLDMAKDHRLVRHVLVESITRSHPGTRDQIEDEKLAGCALFLDQFDSVFTTNYDLVLYWALLFRTPFRFSDSFRWGDNGLHGHLVFSSPTIAPNDDKRIYFLHGALHLFVEDGEVKKRRWGGHENLPLIDQIKSGIANERRYPLFVSEGSSSEKRRQIEASSYLSYCQASFESIEGALFTYGQALSTQDDHILDWIRRNNRVTHFFVGLQGDLLTERNQATILRVRAMHQARGSLEVRFYDSTTADLWTRTGGLPQTRVASKR